MRSSDLKNTSSMGKISTKLSFGSFSSCIDYDNLSIVHQVLKCISVRVVLQASLFIFQNHE